MRSRLSLERLFLARVLEWLPRVVQHAYLLFVVMVGWALFFFTDLSKLRAFFSLAFGLSGAPLTSASTLERASTHLWWLLLALLLCTPVERLGQRLPKEGLLRRRRRPGASALAGDVRGGQ